MVLLKHVFIFTYTTTINPTYSVDHNVILIDDRMAREILDKAHSIVKPGVTTDEIDRVVS